MISVCNPLSRFYSGNAPSSLGQFSINGDGRMVAFASFASDLVGNDFNQDCDVFIRDLMGNSNILVSVGMDGNSGQGGPSHSPIISADGRFVIFMSGATNLAAGDTNAASDVFRRDLLAGTTELVSANSSGSSLSRYDAYSPVCSMDGRYVAFLCRTNPSSALTNLFWRDMDPSVTRSVSGNAHPTREISISADGQRLAYFDSQSRLYVWDANLLSNIYMNAAFYLRFAALSPSGSRVLYIALQQLFVYDLAGASNLFLCPGAVPMTESSPWSGDDRYVAFVTATNLLAWDDNGTNDVYFCDLQTGTLTLVSANQSGTASAAGPSDSPVVSTDGRFVAFRSYAPDVAAGIGNLPSLVLFDRVAGTNSLLVTGTIGTGWTSWMSRPVLSMDGAKLTFLSWDSGLVDGDLNRAGDVFAADLSYLPALDSDADGIPDWWTIHYFGHPTGQGDDFSRASDDADGDGMNNLGEFIAGTIPSDSGSVLAVRVASDASGTNVLLGWDATPGRNYQVLSATNLSDPVWQALPGSVIAIGSQRYFSVQPADSQRFFRVLCGN